MAAPAASVVGTDAGRRLDAQRQRRDEGHHAGSSPRRRPTRPGRAVYYQPAGEQRAEGDLHRAALRRHRRRRPDLRPGHARPIPARRSAARGRCSGSAGCTGSPSCSARARTRASRRPTSSASPRARRPGTWCSPRTSSSVPNLRTGTPRHRRGRVGQTITVTVDGKQYRAWPSVPVPATVLPVFTAGTGSADRRARRLRGVDHVRPRRRCRRLAAAGPTTGRPPWRGSDTDLTQAVVNQAGTVIYPRAVSTANDHGDLQRPDRRRHRGQRDDLRAAQPSTTAPPSAATGSGLGLAEATGIAVVLSTYPTVGVQSVELHASSPRAPAAARRSPPGCPSRRCRSGTHTVTMTVPHPARQPEPYAERVHRRRTRVVSRREPADDRRCWRSPAAPAGGRTSTCPRRRPGRDRLLARSPAQLPLLVTCAQPQVPLRRQ